MNRRDFVSRVALGSAVACTELVRPAAAAAASRPATVRFLGMMTFVERTDRSFLVATPGQHASHHLTHVPFLMARKGSAVAQALGMAPALGVVPEAFDTQLIGTNPEDFVYRNLDNTAIEILAGPGEAVQNTTTQMAMLQNIAPGKRVRGNLEKWASTTVALRGGRLEDSAGHPDAGKVWSFGTYKQRITDAINFRCENGFSIRLTSGTDVRTFKTSPSTSADLWLISAAVPDARMGNPTDLEHSEVLFDYLVDASAPHARCEDAVGREVPKTELPFVRPTSAALGMAASGTAFPPMMEICILAGILLGD